MKVLENKWWESYVYGSGNEHFYFQSKGGKVLRREKRIIKEQTQNKEELWKMK